MNQSITYPCPPCSNQVARVSGIRIREAGESVNSRHKMRTIEAMRLQADIDYLNKQQAILDWIEWSYPYSDDEWCGLTTRQLAKAWNVGVGTVHRWRRQWEAERLIMTSKVGRRLYMKAGKSIRDITRNLPL